MVDGLSYCVNGLCLIRKDIEVYIIWIEGDDLGILPKSYMMEMILINER